MLTTSASDIFIGEGDSDAFSGTSSTDDSTDLVIDAVEGDDDTLTLAVTTDSADLTVVNVENIDITGTVVGGTTLTVDATNFRNVEELTIARADVGRISGNGIVAVTALDGSNVAAVTTGDNVSALTVTQVTSDGVVVTASGVTGAVTVYGAATVVADDVSSSSVIVSAAGSTGTALATALIDGAVSITTSTTGTVEAGDGNTGFAGDTGTFTGTVSIDASAASTVRVTTTGASTIVADAATTIAVNQIDASGTTITSGLTGTSTTPVVISLDGTATSTVTDVATISAAGVVTIDDQGDAVETLNLSGNGAAVTYTVDAAFGVTTFAATGDYAVNVSIAADDLDGITVSGVTTLTMNAAATGTTDLTDVSATTISTTANHLGNVFTAADASSFVFGADQTGMSILAGTDGDSITITTLDDVTGSTVGTITFGAVDMNDTNDFASIAIVANVAHFTSTTFDADDADVTITGAQDVDLGSITSAGSIDASGSTGDFDATMTALSADVTGSEGTNTITLNGAAVMTLSTGTGDDAITVTDVSDGTVITTGDGDDTVALTDAGSNTFDLGAGDDVVTVASNVDTDSVILFGDGTDDSLVFLSTANVDLSTNSNFGFYEVEEIDVTGTVSGITISADQFELDNEFTLTGNSASADILIVTAAATGSTIDASNVTISTALLTLNGAAGADTITGSAGIDAINGAAGVDTIDAGAGDDTVDGGAGADIVDLGAGNDEYTLAVSGDLASGEVVDGGAGTDTITYSVAAAIDLTLGTFTNFETLATGGYQVTLGQGTGITSVEDYADNTADTFILAAEDTNFASTAAGSSSAVDVAGEWYFLAETATDDGALTFFDEVVGEAVTITLTGTFGGTDDTAAVIGGNIVVSIA